jgi:hypothetical protein
MISKNAKKYKSKWKKEWWKKNSAKAMQYHRDYIRRVREEVIAHYGGKCICCGEKEFVFLTIDHINGGGNKHRKEVGPSSIPRWLRKNNYPKGYQILCHNCNQAKNIKGVCPHQSPAIMG